MNHDDFTQILFSLSCLLTAALGAGYLMKCISWPSVLGELLAGLILGPTILGTLAPSFQQNLFPSHGNVAIAREVIAQLGLLSFLFAAGLEMNFDALGQKKKILVFTSLGGILVPFTFGYNLVYWKPDLFLSTDKNIKLIAVFLGIALSISALPIIARTLLDLGIEKTPFASLVLASATLDDLVGWCFFAVLLEAFTPFHNVSRHQPIWMTISLVIVFASLALFLFRPFVRRIRPLVRLHVREIGLLIGITTIAFLVSSAVMSTLGLHGAFGAFLAGVVFSQNLEKREPVYEIIHQIGVGIFSPLYFVTLGLKANFLADFRLDIVLIILLIACFGKVLGAGVGAWLGGLKVFESIAIGVGMNARGAMEMILASIALDKGIIGKELFVALVIMAILTSMMSGPLMKWLLIKQVNLVTK